MTKTKTPIKNKCVGNDIVIDVTVMSKFGVAKDPKIIALFEWLATHGCLRTNEKLIGKYTGSCNYLIAGLINNLLKEGRHKPISTSDLKALKLPRFRFTCGAEDQWHAKTVFLSERKKLVTFDNKFLTDINNFPLVNKIKPEATKSPDCAFYT
jgi:hypothetical protein